MPDAEGSALLESSSTTLATYKTTGVVGLCEMQIKEYEASETQ